MRTVGRPSKESALKGRDWVPILDTELLGLLHEGHRAYLDKLQDVLNVNALAKVEKNLKLWFGGNLDSAIERSYLKKVNNSASAQGAAAFDRTLQALNEFPKFKELGNAKSSITFERLFSKLNQLESDNSPEFAILDKTYRCNGCENLMHEGEPSLQAMKRMGSKQGQHYWHLQCWFADEVRKNVGEFRKLKGRLDKQSKAARAILTMTPIVKSSEDKVVPGKKISSETDYENWLNGIWETWCSSTQVKNQFHKAYYRDFHEYADLVLLFHLDGNVSKTSFYENFIKHVSSDDIQNKFFKGLTAEPEKKQVISLTPVSYADCRMIGEAFRSLNPVLVDTNNASEDDRKRIIDFISGMTFALHGTIQRVTAGVFLAIPAGAEVESASSNDNTDADLLNFFNTPNARDAAVSKKIVNQ